eukprot:1161507-Pelagomonas_calceolata.AAC.1
MTKFEATRGCQVKSSIDAHSSCCERAGELEDGEGARLIFSVKGCQVQLRALRTGSLSSKLARASLLWFTLPPPWNTVSKNNGCKGSSHGATTIINFF